MKKESSPIPLTSYHFFILLFLIGMVDSKIRVPAEQQGLAFYLFFGFLNFVVALIVTIATSFFLKSSANEK